MDIRTKLNAGVLLFDGAMGTALHDKGIPVGELPELYNLTHPNVILEIHNEYVNAGAQVISTNTFQANRFKIPSEYSIEEIINAGVSLGKKSGASFVALDVGPLGQMLKPLGTLSFENAYDAFKEQMIAGEKSGADCIVIETFSDLLEAKIAILAGKENTKLPIFCTMTFQEDGRTFMGTDPLTAVVTLEGLGIDALGVNCSLGPKELMPTIETLLEYSHIPVMVQANAGLPQINNGKTEYLITPEEFSNFSVKMIKKGVRIIGGCCGTTPEFIKQISKKINTTTLGKVVPKNISSISSGLKTVIFDKNVTVIGERINPTGKPKLKEAILNNKMDYILKEAIDQANAGSDILDVNVGLPDINEAEVLKTIVSEIQSITSLPLQIDSSDSKAIESAVRIYNGKPLINSVNGKKESMEVIFPIAKKYGAMVLGLTLNEEGIPLTAEGRFEIAKNILETALSFGIPKENILIDCLALTVSAQQEQALETLKAIRMVKDKLNLHTVLGVSNISFGLPARQIINSTFLSSALGAGLDAPILNPMSKDYMEVIHSFRVLNNQDKNASYFIETYGNKTVSIKNVSVSNVDLKSIILEGRKEEAPKKVKELLNSGVLPLEIIDLYFASALNEIGEKFEKKEIFLPQLLQSAETVKSGFVVLKNHMDSLGLKTETKGKIIIATVQGDIHDIGKNIVGTVLENYGYDIYDLGKDVPIEKVVAEVKKHNIKLVGLSALMTTTVQNMKKTIFALKDAGLDCKIMVGGAVLNEEYANLVGADFYAKDAMDSVVIANKVFLSKAKP